MRTLCFLFCFCSFALEGLDTGKLRLSKLTPTVKHGNKALEGKVQLQLFFLKIHQLVLTRHCMPTRLWIAGLGCVLVSVLFPSCAAQRDYVPLVKVDDSAMRSSTSSVRPFSPPESSSPSGGASESSVTMPPPTDPTSPPSDAQQSTALNPGTIQPMPSPTTSVTQAPRYPWGRKIAGRPGFVLSPHAPDQGIVDVTDPATGQPYPRGTEVLCPFTNRIFLVP